MTVRVVHHLSEPAIFFNEVSRVLKPESLFFLEFANKRNLKNILKFLAGKAAGSPFGREPLQVGDTILDYHPVYIKSLLKDLKFKVLKQLSVSNFRLGYLKKHVGLKTLLFFENLYQNLFSFADLGPSIFLKTEFVRQTGHESDKGNFSGSETGEISSESSSFRNISRGDLSLKDMLQCPGCSGDIFFSGGSLYDALALSGQTKMDDKKLKNAEILCSRCARKYPVKDGVMIFRELN